MATVDYFAGQNEGNKNLMNALDTYTKDERQKRQDALTNQLLQEKVDQAQSRRNTLADISRISGLTEKTPATTRITTALSQEPVEQMSSPTGINRLTGITEPTEQIAEPTGLSQRPTITSAQENIPAQSYLPREKHQMMLDSALKNGDWESVKSLGTVIDMTTKIRREDSDRLSWWATQVREFKKKTGNAAAAKQFGIQLAKSEGIPEEQVSGIDFTSTDDIYKPDGQGGLILIHTSPDGSEKLIHISSTKPPSSVASAYLDAIKADIKKSNPTMDDKEVELKAAKQIRAEDEESKIRAAKEGRAVFGVIPNATTGASYFRAPDAQHPEKGWYLDTDNGPMKLNSDQMRNLSLTTKEETPTARTKTMEQLAPKVMERAETAKRLIEGEINRLGPLDSRARNLWAKNIGGPDPNYTRIRTTSDLLATLLANMHVGASGAEKTIERFSQMLDVKTQSPDNLLANINEIMKYAEAAKNPSIKRMPLPNAPNSNQPAFDISGKPGTPIRMSNGGKTYVIPIDKVDEFIKDHPKAQVMR